LKGKRLGSVGSSVTPGDPGEGIQDKFAALGIANELDLVLHLPLRYEDETHLYPIAATPPDRVVQVEGTIIQSEVMYRPRRQLVCQVEDDTGVLFIRFLNFYGSQVKAYSVGKRVRLLGEVRQGFFGAEMVHPKCHMVGADTPLPDALTPIYPTTAGLSQETIRKRIRQALAHSDQTGSLNEVLPAEVLKRYQLQDFRESVIFLHQPTADASVALLQEGTHPAWGRIKFDELLAQQLSLRLHYQKRRSRCAPALPEKNLLTSTLLQLLSFDLTGSQKKVLAEISSDHGPDRNSCRAALSKTLQLVHAAGNYDCMVVR